jgi:hypothetical protein
LRRAVTAETSQKVKMIPKPRGSVGAAGFSLIAEMKLNKHDPADKTLYNDILVRCIKSPSILVTYIWCRRLYVHLQSVLASILAVDTKINR